MDGVARGDEEEEDDMSGDLYIGKLWFRLEGLDSKEWKQKGMCVEERIQY